MHNEPARGVESGLLDSYLTIAGSYQALGLIETAIQYNAGALDAAEQVGDNESRDNALIQKAELLDLTEQTEAAIEVLVSAQEARGLGSRGLMLLGSLYAKAGQIDKA